MSVCVESELMCLSQISGSKNHVRGPVQLLAASEFHCLPSVRALI